LKVVFVNDSERVHKLFSKPSKTRLQQAFQAIFRTASDDHEAPLSSHSDTPLDIGF